jgi:hypothetical protein
VRRTYLRGSGGRCLGWLRLTMSKRLVTLMLLVLCIGIMSTKVEAQIPEPQPSATPTPAPTVSAEELVRQERLLKLKVHKLHLRIRRDKLATWHWQDIMQKPHSKAPAKAQASKGLSPLKGLARIWHRRKLRSNYRAHHPPYLSAWLCIHSHEGSWAATTGNGYYGGLQMDWTFMSMYGRRLLQLKGPANNWTPLEQIWVAVNAAFRHGRGFYPWPNTARMCGLI